MFKFQKLLTDYLNSENKYVLSRTDPKLSEKDLEKSKTVKDEMYGLLMGFE